MKNRSNSGIASYSREILQTYTVVPNGRWEISPPKGHLAVSRDMLDCHDWRECSRHPAGKGQGCWVMI